jgi:Protein of unknown function (DUF2934)
MADHDHLVIQAIARRAFELHESAGSHHGRDHHDWFQAEQKLTILDSQLNVEADGLVFMVQIPVEAEHRTKIFASVSPWSILLLTVPDASMVDACCQSDLQDLIRYVSLPREVIPDQVTASLDEHGLRLWLPIMLEGAIPTDAVISSAIPREGHSPVIRTLLKGLEQSLPNESTGWPPEG